MYSTPNPNPNRLGYSGRDRVGGYEGRVGVGVRGRDRVGVGVRGRDRVGVGYGWGIRVGVGARVTYIH